MWRMKKWFVRTYLSCINQVEDQELVCSNPKIMTCSYPRIIYGNVTPAQYARMPFPSANTPVHTNSDIYATKVSMNNKEEKAEAKQDNKDFAPSFRYFVFDTESRNPRQAVKEGQIPQQLHDPEAEEFSFWPSNDSVPKELDQESDEVFLQDQIMPTLMISSDGESAINPSSNEEPESPEEDFDPHHDLEDCFGLRKLYGGYDEEKEEHEKQNDKGLYVDEESRNKEMKLKYRLQILDQILHQLLHPKEPLPTLMVSSDGPTEDTLPPIPSSDEERASREEDFGSDDLEDCLECPKVNAEIAQTWKHYGSSDEEHEKRDDKDLHDNKEPGNKEIKQGTDQTTEEILDPEEPFQFQGHNLPMRISFNARSTSRCISVDGSCSYSAGFTSASSKSSSTSSPQSENKPDCCIVPHQITKAEILFSKILRFQKTAFWRLLRAPVSPVHTSKTSASRARLDRMSSLSLCKGR